MGEIRHLYIYQFPFSYGKVGEILTIGLNINYAKGTGEN